MKNSSPMRYLWMALGMVCLVLGTIGVVLPILPTVPFYMATLFCFAKSSEKLHSWFLGTSLYKKHLESFVANRSMTRKSKLTIMGTVTVVMAIGFLCMKSVPVGRICLVIVWVAHVMYFTFGIRTASEEETTEEERPESQENSPEAETLEEEPSEEAVSE